jgi:uncharacterized DUF497 family protein
MEFQVTGFDWDHGNRTKCRKHGVSIAEIEGIFENPVAVLPNPSHSLREERFKAIGLTRKGRRIFLSSRYASEGSRH